MPDASSAALSPNRKLTKPEIRNLVTEGAALALVVERAKPAEKRLEEIKALLRQAAGELKEPLTYEGAAAARATLKPVADGLARSVPENLLAKVRRLAGGAIDTLFALAPRKDFELLALQKLTKGDAEKLVASLRTPGSPRVTFSGGAEKKP